MNNDVTNDLAFQRALIHLERFNTVDDFVAYWSAVGKWPSRYPSIERI